MRNLQQAFGHAAYGFVGQGEPVERGGVQTVGTGGGHILGVGRKQRGAAASNACAIASSAWFLALVSACAIMREAARACWPTCCMYVLMFSIVLSCIALLLVPSRAFYRILGVWRTYRMLRCKCRTGPASQILASCILTADSRVIKCAPYL